MSINGFATNNLVEGHDNYVKFMKRRHAYIKEEGGPTEALFCMRNLVVDTFGISSKDSQHKLNTLHRDISLWHCIILSYDIWYDCVKDCVEEGHGSINYKKFVNVPDDILKKYKFRFEQSIANAKCDYRSYTNPDQRKSLNACRYLARFWTYLDIIKDEKTQRFFPNKETIGRASKIFGYKKGENPFIMNGKFRKNAVRSNSEEKVDIAEQAAKEVEERVMPEPLLRDLREVYNDLKNDYDELDAKYDSVLKKARETSDAYDELLKQKLEIEAYNARLKNDIDCLKEDNEVLKLRAKPKTDILAILADVVVLMKRSSTGNLKVTISDMTVDIHHKDIVRDNARVDYRTYINGKEV